MYELIATAVAFFVLFRMIQDQARKLESLKLEVKTLQRRSVAAESPAAPEDVAFSEPPAEVPEPILKPEPVAETQPMPEPAPRPVADPPPSVWARSPAKPASPPKEEAPRPSAARQAPSRPVDWERTLGVQLPVWGGAIMLLIAGFFLVNWAVEAGITSIFTPEVRVILCAIASASMMVGAFVVKAGKIANGDRIASALATASLAVGYGTLFLAASVFNLVPGFVALGGSMVVTGLAIYVAMQFDQRVMIVGLLGGYLSPLFAWQVGDPAGIVPYYVGVLMAVSLFTIRLNRWWGQGIPAMIGPLFWVAILMLARDPITLSLFYVSLAAIPVAVFFAPIPDRPAVDEKLREVVLAGFSVASLMLFLAIIYQNNHPIHLASMIALSAGSLALTWVDHVNWIKVGQATLAGSLLMLVFQYQRPTMLFVAGILVLAGIHIGTLVLRYLQGVDRTRKSFEIVGVSGAFFLILLVKTDGWIGARDIPYFWAIVSFIVAAHYGLLAYRSEPATQGDTPQVGFAAGTSAFLSMGLGLVVDPGLYALVASLQALGMAILYARYRVHFALWMHVVYVGLYGALLLIGQAASSTNIIYFSPAFFIGGLIDFIPQVGVDQAPITLLLLPGIALLAAAFAIARVSYGAIAKALDVGSVVLIAAGVHFVILPVITTLIFQQAFVLGAYWFNGIGAIALAAVVAGQRFDRRYLNYAGLFLGGWVAFVMLGWALLPIFQFWPKIYTPGLPILNVALLALGMPAGIMLALAYLARQQGAGTVAKIFAGFGGFTGLMLVLVLIRQAIQGPELIGATPVPGQIELYLYSAGMLAYGFALLWGGARFSSVALRGGSLVVVLATIGKVFLYDVSGLEGLWRVGSFLGMGVALLVVSWFYGRFVFGLGAGGNRAKAQ